MDVDLVHNPNAGSGTVGGAELVELIRAAGHEATGRSTGDDGWEGRVRAGGAEVVAVAGGDGTVRDVLTALAGTGATVGVIATGTANNIAHSVGTPVDDPEAAVAVWSAGIGRPFDLPRIRTGAVDGRFVESVGGGVFADLLRVAEAREQATGEDGDTRDGLRMLRGVVADAPERRWRIDVDGQDRSGAYLAVEVMNIGRVGPNVELSPDADPGDGLLDVVLLGADDREALLEYIDHLVAAGPPGEATAAPDLPIVRGRRVELGVPEGALLHLDDEPLDPEGSDPSGRSIELEVLDDRLTILVPAPGRRSDGAGQ